MGGASSRADALSRFAVGAPAAERDAAIARAYLAAGGPHCMVGTWRVPPKQLDGGDMAAVVLSLERLARGRFHVDAAPAPTHAEELPLGAGSEDTADTASDRSLVGSPIPHQGCRPVGPPAFTEVVMPHSSDLFRSWWRGPQRSVAALGLGLRHLRLTLVHLELRGAGLGPDGLAALVAVLWPTVEVFRHDGPRPVRSASPTPDPDRSGPWDPEPGDAAIAGFAPPDAGPEDDGPCHGGALLEEDEAALGAVRRDGVAAYLVRQAAYPLLQHLGLAENAIEDRGLDLLAEALRAVGCCPPAPGSWTSVEGQRRDLSWRAALLQGSNTRRGVLGSLDLSHNGLSDRAAADIARLSRPQLVRGHTADWYLRPPLVASLVCGGNTVPVLQWALALAPLSLHGPGEDAANHTAAAQRSIPRDARDLYEKPEGECVRAPSCTAVEVSPARGVSEASDASCPEATLAVPRLAGDDGLRLVGCDYRPFAARDGRVCLDTLLRYAQALSLPGAGVRDAAFLSHGSGHGPAAPFTALHDVCVPVPCRFTALTSLSLRANGLTDAGLRALFPFAAASAAEAESSALSVARSARRSRRGDVEEEKRQQAAAARWADGGRLRGDGPRTRSVTGLRLLTSLDLADNSLTAAGVHTLAEALSPAEALANVVMGERGYVTLDAARARDVTDESSVSELSPKPHLWCLRRLVLDGNPVGAAAVPLLCALEANVRFLQADPELQLHAREHPASGLAVTALATAEDEAAATVGRGALLSVRRCGVAVPAASLRCGDLGPALPDAGPSAPFGETPAAQESFAAPDGTEGAALDPYTAFVRRRRSESVSIARSAAERQSVGHGATVVRLAGPPPPVLDCRDNAVLSAEHRCGDVGCDGSPWWPLFDAGCVPVPVLAHAEAVAMLATAHAATRAPAGGEPFDAQCAASGVPAVVYSAP